MNRIPPGPRPRHQRRARTGPATEAGSSSLQMVILIPVLLALPFLGIQAALLHHARSVAVAAASEGARTAAAELGTEADGAAAASAYLEAVGDRALPVSSVSVTRTATTARAVVTGESLSVIPLWTPRISQQSTASVERLTTRTDP